MFIQIWQQNWQKLARKWLQQMTSSLANSGIQRISSIMQQTAFPFNYVVVPLCIHQRYNSITY